MKKLLYLTFIPALFWMFIIFGFSKESGGESSSMSLAVTQKIVDIIDFNERMTEEEYEHMVSILHNPVRKAAHMSEYAVLAFLIYIPLLLNIRFKKTYEYFIVTILVCLIYAAADEIHQLFVPGRDGRITDVMIDSIGSVAASLIFLGIHNFAHRKIVSKREQRLHRKQQTLGN